MLKGYEANTFIFELISCLIALASDIKISNCTFSEVNIITNAQYQVI